MLVEDYRLRRHPWKAQQLKQVNIYLRTALQDRGSTQPPRQATQLKQVNIYLRTTFQNQVLQQNK
ncbi:hypothetical protein CD128_06685 [Staphylococcus croceilyticus]|nr:hypothetical protein CD128_06685 [Staphylococcus croceilyticus]